jgi:glycosyltransferase involved in cell wall biosynthesis
MKTIQVYLKAGAHPIYSELIKNPPADVNYVNVPTRRKEKIESGIQKELAIKTLNLLPIPRMFFARTNADLIHSTRGILILNKKPWVMDMENAGSFVNHNYDRLKNPLIKTIIKKSLSSKLFKKLMPHSKIAYKSISASLGIALKNKYEILYPTTYVKNYKRKIKDDFIKILFVGRYFYEKGANDLLEAFKILNKKYDVQLTLVSDAPKEVLRQDIPNLIVKKPDMPREELFKNYYFNSHVFVYPTYFDTTAFVVIEAMSAGLPVIATDNYAIPEYIENEKTGFLIKSPLHWHGKNGLPTWSSGEKYRKLTREKHSIVIKEIVKKLGMLIENKSLRIRIGRNAKKYVEKGKLSIKERNKKLRGIYEEAIKD